MRGKNLDNQTTNSLGYAHFKHFLACFEIIWLKSSLWHRTILLQLFSEFCIKAWCWTAVPPRISQLYDKWVFIWQSWNSKIIYGMQSLEGHGTLCTRCFVYKLQQVYCHSLQFMFPWCKTNSWQLVNTLWYKITLDMFSNNTKDIDQDIKRTSDLL